MTASGEDARPVTRSRSSVWVGDRVVARSAGWFSINIERSLSAVRDRTSDDWWRMAAAIDEAMEPPTTRGPLGAGVDFFADPGWDLVPGEVREEIESDAYEAAREAILSGIDGHIRRVTPTLAALTHIGGSVPTPPGEVKDAKEETG